MKVHTQKYEEVKHLINEGDVLLFRGQGFFSYLLWVFDKTTYSHVGVASWINGSRNTKEGILECVEFREGFFGGGRAVSLESQVKKFPGRIDVYRPIRAFEEYCFDETEKKVYHREILFDGKAVTDIIRRMTGLPYGWRRIWWMMLHKLFLWRLFSKESGLMIDQLSDIVYPVCSTAVAYAFNKNNFDLIKNKSDDWTEPGDIAKSPRLSYLFTLC